MIHIKTNRTSYAISGEMHPTTTTTTNHMQEQQCHRSESFNHELISSQYSETRIFQQSSQQPSTNYNHNLSISFSHPIPRADNSSSHHQQQHQHQSEPVFQNTTHSSSKIAYNKTDDSSITIRHNGSPYVRSVGWDINDEAVPKVSHYDRFNDWADGHCRAVYRANDEQARRHASGWAMRNTNNHNVNILKKSCLGVMVCSEQCVIDEKLGNRVHLRPHICDKARKKQQGKACPNRKCTGHLQILSCKGHCGYPVTHFWRHTPEAIFFQSKGVHDHPRPEPKSSAETRRAIAIARGLIPINTSSASKNSRIGSIKSKKKHEEISSLKPSNGTRKLVTLNSNKSNKSIKYKRLVRSTRKCDSTTTNLDDTITKTAIVHNKQSNDTIDINRKLDNNYLSVSANKTIATTRVSTDVIIKSSSIGSINYKNTATGQELTSNVKPTSQSKANLNKSNPATGKKQTTRKDWDATTTATRATLLKSLDLDQKMDKQQQIMNDAEHHFNQAKANYHGLALPMSRQGDYSAENNEINSYNTPHSPAQYHNDQHYGFEHADNNTVQASGFNTNLYQHYQTNQQSHDGSMNYHQQSTPIMQHVNNGFASAYEPNNFFTHSLPCSDCNFAYDVDARNQQDFNQQSVYNDNYTGNYHQPTPLSGLGSAGGGSRSSPSSCATFATATNHVIFNASNGTTTHIPSQLYATSGKTSDTNNCNNLPLPASDTIDGQSNRPDYLATNLYGSTNVESSRQYGFAHNQTSVNTSYGGSAIKLPTTNNHDSTKMVSMFDSHANSYLTADQSHCADPILSPSKGQMTRQDELNVRSTMHDDPSAARLFVVDGRRSIVDETTGSNKNSAGKLVQVSNNKQIVASSRLSPPSSFDQAVVYGQQRQSGAEVKQSKQERVNQQESVYSVGRKASPSRSTSSSTTPPTLCSSSSCSSIIAGDVLTTNGRDCVSRRQTAMGQSDRVVNHPNQRHHQAASLIANKRLDDVNCNQEASQQRATTDSYGRRRQEGAFQGESAVVTTKRSDGPVSLAAKSDLNSNFYLMAPASATTTSASTTTTISNCSAATVSGNTNNPNKTSTLAKNWSNKQRTAPTAPRHTSRGAMNEATHDGGGKSASCFGSASSARQVGGTIGRQMDQLPSIHKANENNGNIVDSSTNCDNGTSVVLHSSPVAITNNNANNQPYLHQHQQRLHIDLNNNSGSSSSRLEALATGETIVTSLGGGGCGHFPPILASHCYPAETNATNLDAPNHYWSNHSSATHESSNGMNHGSGTAINADHNQESMLLCNCDRNQRLHLGQKHVRHQQSNSNEMHQSYNTNNNNNTNNGELPPVNYAGGHDTSGAPFKHIAALKSFQEINEPSQRLNEYQSGYDLTSAGLTNTQHQYQTCSIDAPIYTTIDNRLSTASSSMDMLAGSNQSEERVYPMQIESHDTRAMSYPNH